MMLALYEKVVKARKEMLEARQNDEKKMLTRRIRRLTDTMRGVEDQLKVFDQSEVVNKNIVEQKMLVGGNCVLPLANALKDGTKLLKFNPINTVQLSEPARHLQGADTYFDRASTSAERGTRNMLVLESSSTDLRHILKYNVNEIQEMDSMGSFHTEEINGCLVAMSSPIKKK